MQQLPSHAFSVLLNIVWEEVFELHHGSDPNWEEKSTMLLYWKGTFFFSHSVPRYCRMRTRLLTTSLNKRCPIGMLSALLVSSDALQKRMMNAKRDSLCGVEHAGWPTCQITGRNCTEHKQWHCPREVVRSHYPAMQWVK